MGEEANVPELETTDILDVDLLAAGGPYHGTGSPPEGDFYDEDALQRIADDTNRLLAAGELRSPVKLGHSREQRLLRDSGFSDGEMPAAGWVDNLRVEGGKLRADLRRVPKTLADLINVGAFRTRSVELRSVQSQSDGGRSGPVVSALAWLGAKAPAVRSLDDVVALYSDQPPLEEDDVTIVEYDETAWNPDWGYRAIQSQIHERLAQEGRDYRVQDIGPDRALVKEGEVTWVVPFVVDGESVEIAERSEWSLGQPAWAEAAEHVIAMCEAGVAADNPGEMENTEITQEQVTMFAERLGIDPEEFTVDAALAALDERPKALAEDEVVVPADELAELRAGAAAGADAAQKLYALERDTFLHEAVEDGRINPGDLEKWVARYEANTEMTREIVTDLKPVEAFSREYGREGDPDEAEEKLARAFSEYMGVVSSENGR